MEPAVISPNADGIDDATNIRYTLGRRAEVSIYFEDQQGNRHYFRRDQLRSPGKYGVAWGGVINEPEIIDSGHGPQQVLGRVLPDGDYPWTIEATDKRGQTDTQSGTITLVDGDTVLPELQNFTVVPQRFPPNQDGLATTGCRSRTTCPKMWTMCRSIWWTPTSQTSSTPSPRMSG